MYLHYFFDLSKKISHEFTLASIMGLDPDYKLMPFVKTRFRKHLHPRFGKDLIKLPVHDCFVFDKAMHEIPCIQFMTMWKINKIAFYLVFKNDGRNHAVLVEPDAGNPLIHSSS